MKNLITIKTHEKNHKLAAEDYCVFGGSDDKVHMMTNLKPEELLIFLMPFLVEIEKIVNDESVN